MCINCYGASFLLFAASEDVPSLWPCNEVAARLLNEIKCFNTLLAVLKLVCLLSCPENDKHESRESKVETKNFYSALRNLKS